MRNHRNAQYLGLAVMVATAGKLLLFDLETVERSGESSCFMAFGGAMLYISYLVPRWQRDDHAPTAG